MHKTLKKGSHRPEWVTVAWVLGLIVVWEIGATVIASVKRSPENVLPHLYQIVESRALHPEGERTADRAPDWCFPTRGSR